MASSRNEENLVPGKFPVKNEEEALLLLLLLWIFGLPFGHISIPRMYV